MHKKYETNNSISKLNKPTTYIINLVSNVLTIFNNFTNKKPHSIKIHNNIFNEIKNTYIPYNY